MGEVTAGATAVLTAAEDHKSILQEAAAEDDVFSAGGPIGKKNEGEDDVREDTLGRSVSAIEVVVPI